MDSNHRQESYEDPALPLNYTPKNLLVLNEQG